MRENFGLLAAVTATGSGAWSLLLCDGSGLLVGSSLRSDTGCKLGGFATGPEVVLLLLASMLLWLMADEANASGVGFVVVVVVGKNEDGLVDEESGGGCCGCMGDVVCGSVSTTVGGGGGGCPKGSLTDPDRAAIYHY